MENWRKDQRQKQEVCVVRMTAWAIWKDLIEQNSDWRQETMSDWELLGLIETTGDKHPTAITLFVRTRSRGGGSAHRGLHMQSLQLLCFLDATKQLLGRSETHHVSSNSTGWRILLTHMTVCALLNYCQEHWKVIQFWLFSPVFPQSTGESDLTQGIFLLEHTSWVMPYFPSLALEF